MGRARIPQLGDFPIEWTPSLRARYAALVPYYPWLADVNEAYQFRMATTSVYRPAFRQSMGGPRTIGKQPEPWKELPRPVIDHWRARNLDERWATSDKTAQALAWLEQEFSDQAGIELKRAPASTEVRVL